ELFVREERKCQPRTENHESNMPKPELPESTQVVRGRHETKDEEWQKAQHPTPGEGLIEMGGDGGHDRNCDTEDQRIAQRSQERSEYPPEERANRNHSVQEGVHKWTLKSSS